MDEIGAKVINKNKNNCKLLVLLSVLITFLFTCDRKKELLSR